ncbi:hypothetical protein E4U16_000495 [Claviceps sp. LM84 group G4]|nr:hypothetical protein E4U16_000495 [Claviceps sp. LM84 group G4]
MSNSPTTERAPAALDPDDFEGYDEVWRDQRRRERCRSPPANEPPANEPLGDELQTGLHTASNSHTGPFKLSSGGEHTALFTEKLQFTHKVPLYPNTHPEGYTYVVPAQFVDELDKLPMQLGLTIKVPHDWKQLEQWRSKVDLYEPDERLQRASRWYNSNKHLFFQGAACDPRLPSCRPRIHKASISDDTGPYYITVRCTNYHSETGRGHVRKDLGPQTVIDVDYLQRLFDNHYETAPTDLCGTWDTNTKKKTQCVSAAIGLEEISDRRDMDYGICNQAKQPNWKKHYIALQREVRKKQKRYELENRIQENLNPQGGESSAFPEADVEDVHRSGTTRMPAGQPFPPRNPSPQAGQDQTVRPTVELQSPFEYPAGFTRPPSQGRDNNGRSLSSRTLEQTQYLLNEQLVEKQRLANEAERLRQAGEAQRQAGIAQRQGFNQRLMNLREEFTRSILRRIEAGETEFDPRIFDFVDT